MNKKNFLIIVAAVLSIVGVLNVNIKTVSAAEINTTPAATIAETPVPTAGVTKAVSEIDFSEPVAETEPAPVVEPEPTYSINEYDGLSQTRYCIVNTAMGMSGQFTYNLGSKPDYNNNWKTGESLDCSGFVEYVFWLVTGQDIGEGTWMQSTENVEGGRAQYISHEELKPGDLAFLMMVEIQYILTKMARNILVQIMSAYIAARTLKAMIFGVIAMPKTIRLQ